MAMKGIGEARTGQMRIDPGFCRVLVVDDDHLVRAHLMAVLNRAGFQVQGASEGVQALQMLSLSPCDVLLMDWEMPGMDGPALCRALRTRIGMGHRTKRVESRLSVSWARSSRLSLCDPLTGGHDNRFLITYLPRELELSRRFNPPLAILSCDIDHFRQTNDAFGRDAAEQVLNAFVGLTRTILRDGTDWIVRVGGDQFIIVLPDTTLHSAGRVADRLREALAGAACPTNAGPINSTVSIGVTALETPTEAFAESAETKYEIN